MPSSPAYTRPTTVGTGWTAGARFSQNYENKTPLASPCAGKNGKKIITKPRYTNGTGLPETKNPLFRCAKSYSSTIKMFTKPLAGNPAGTRMAGDSAEVRRPCTKAAGGPMACVFRGSHDGNGSAWRKSNSYTVKMFTKKRIRREPIDTPARFC